MLVTFTTQGHERITMFGDVAQVLLKRMGHSGMIPSAILAKDVPEALEKLKKTMTTKSSNDQDKPYDAEDISLRHRALPLIQLLETAATHHHDVLWEEY